MPTSGRYYEDGHTFVLSTTTLAAQHIPVAALR
jgi:hypothetical protein